LKLRRELDGPEVIFVPIDEPRVEARKKITIDLLKSVKKIKGTRTMSSTDVGGRLLDIENNSTRHGKRLGPGEFERKSERKVWEYHNGAISCTNPGFSRYIYGYYTWRQDLDGMNSWGFNTAENSRGHPYEDLDHAYSDWNLAYPHQGGPLPSVNWEALREGIDDVRYVYQLEKLIGSCVSSHPELAAQATGFLNEVRGSCDIDERTMAAEFGPWTPEVYDQTRGRVIEWILRLQGLK
jgi:glycosyl hydrolase family 123